MAMTETTPSMTQDTRTRLVQTALSVFARRDFDAVSVREIVDLAEANIAAVSYHFGGKEGLYLATAEFLADTMLGRMQPLLAKVRSAAKTADDEDAAELLRELIHGLVHNLLNDGVGDNAAGFILREQLQPTAAFDILFERLMVPIQRTYQALIIRLADDLDATDKRQQVLVTHALMGQILAFRIARTTVLRRLDQARFQTQDLDDIANHIHTLTLRALAPGSSDSRART